MPGKGSDQDVRIEVPEDDGDDDGGEWEEVGCRDLLGVMLVVLVGLGYVVGRFLAALEMTGG